MPQSSKEETIRGTGKKQNSGLYHKVCRASQWPGNLLTPLGKGCCREDSTQGKAKFVVNQGTGQGGDSRRPEGQDLPCSYASVTMRIASSLLSPALQPQQARGVPQQIRDATPSPAASPEVLLYTCSHAAPVLCLSLSI